MAYSNDFNLTGTVGRKPERMGRGPWKFSLAVGGGKKKGSDDRWPTEWFDCISWPDKTTGDSPAEAINKGEKVTLHGRLKVEQWKDKDTGKDRSKVVLDVLEIDIEAGRQVEAKEQPAQSAPGRTEITDDDIPF